MNLNTDVIDNIYTYLSYNDTCAMDCVSNQTGTPASMIRQAAALNICTNTYDGVLYAALHT